MNINTDQLIAILGKEKADSLFLNPEWIKKQYKYKVNDMKYLAYQEFGRLEDLGSGTYKGSLHLREIGPQILDHLPKIKKLFGYVDVCKNNLTSLKGSPEEVVGDFDCYMNELTDLIGSPRIVHGDFSCFYNKLTSLNGIPEVIKYQFKGDYALEIERTPDGKTYRLVEK